MKEFGLLWEKQKENVINVLESGKIVYKNKMYQPVSEIKTSNGKTVYCQIEDIEAKLTRQKDSYLYKNTCGTQYLVFANKVYVFESTYEKELNQQLFDNDNAVSLLNKDSNYLIQGDNLHSLQLIQAQYKESVDFICIDPPYNTGNEDMKYNDMFRTYKHNQT